MRRGLVATVVIAAIAAVAISVWMQHKRVERAEAEAGLASARILDGVFERTSSLAVLTLTGNAQARSEHDGWTDSVQVTKAPFGIVYTIDLKRMSSRDFRWNARDRIMTVEVPAVTVGQPSIDMARAQVKQSGVWISRSAGQDLQRQGVARLRNVVAAEANKPENIVRAQAAARAAVEALVAAPLAASGQANVRVAVRLPGEAKPVALTTEQWDLSRSIAEVLAGD